MQPWQQYRQQQQQPSPRPRRRRRVARVLWALVPVCSFGFLSSVPFLARAFTTGRHKDWAVTAGYLAGTAAMITFMAFDAGPNQPPNGADGVVGALAVVLAGFGSVHAWLVHAGPLLPTPPAAAALAPAGPSNAHALAAARAAAERRAEARELVRTDPALARDLRIGRPDLQREYDDGGLVDVNHAPADALARALGWPLAEAEAITAARATAGDFSSTAELSAYTSLNPYRIDAVADLMVFCRM